MSRGSIHLPPGLSTVVDLLTWRAEQHPDRVAFRFLPEGEIDEALTLSYQGLDLRARTIAALLQDLNAQGQRVLLLYQAGLDYVTAFFACLYAGAIAVPAYPPRPNRSLNRLQSIIRDSQAAIALTDTAILDKLERRFDECPELKALYWLSTETLEEDLADNWQRPAAMDQNSLALLQYTSGSTADPKGVMIGHGNLLHNSSLINQCFQDTAESEGVSWLPPYHDMGLVGGILQPLYVGATMTLMPPVAFLQKPARWLTAISHYQATTSGGPNFAYDLCIRKVSPEQRQLLDLSRWTLAFSGAEPIHYTTLQQFYETFAPQGFAWEAFYPCYGMAETTLLVTGGDKQRPPLTRSVDAKALLENRAIAPADPEQERQLVGCGSPAIPDSVLIVDPDQRVACPEDRVGEIWVSQSPSIAQGYWQRPEQTEYSFAGQLANDVSETYLRTGDLGFFHGHELYVTGRLKDLIIIRGRNHYPQDIEATVERAHPALRPGCGAAFSVDMAGAEQLVIVQELERSHLRKVEPDEVFAAIQRQVAEHHELQVGAIALLKTNSLPKTSSGKIQRYLCRMGFLDNQLNAVFEWQAGSLAGPSLAELTASEKHYDQEPSSETRRLAQPQSAVADKEAIATTTHPTATQARISTPTEIQQWMVQWLSQALQVPATTIDIRKPFAEYGLDSVAAVEMADGLQTALGISLSPTLAYEYPTIEALSNYLGAPPATATPPPAPSAPAEFSSGDAEVEQLVRELEMLSDAEIQELLGKQGN